MANRVTATEVKQIMDNCTVDDQVVDSFITGANALVTQVFLDDTEITTALKKEIEKWLSAHMIASTIFRMTSEEKIGDAQVKFTGLWKEKLSSTSYGQMVLMLDITGKMARAGKTAASIYAVKSFNTTTE